MKWRRDLGKGQRSGRSMGSGTGSGPIPARGGSTLIARKSPTSSGKSSKNSTEKRGQRLGKGSGTSSAQLALPNPLDTFRTESIPTQSGSLIGPPFQVGLSPPLPDDLSTKCLWYPSAKPTPVIWTSTIRFTCPLCSAEHFQNIHWYSSMKRRTLAQLTIKCSKSFEEVGSLALAIPSNPSTSFVEPVKMEWASSLEPFL